MQPIGWSGSGLIIVKACVNGTGASVLQSQDWVNLYMSKDMQTYIVGMIVVVGMSLLPCKASENADHLKNKYTYVWVALIGIYLAGISLLQCKVCQGAPRTQQDKYIRLSRCGRYLLGWGFPATMRSVRERRFKKKSFKSTHTFKSLWSAFTWLGFPCYKCKA